MSHRKCAGQLGTCTWQTLSVNFALSFIALQILECQENTNVRAQSGDNMVLHFVTVAMATSW